MAPQTVTADELDALLPQTQCARCGYPACRPYAEALAAGTAQINRCPPGGDASIAALARALDRPVLALDPECGEAWTFRVAVIDEAWCIGCTLCIQACPVDAIVGAGKAMHSVIAQDCSGCELCVPPCPTDCIQLMHPTDHPQHREIVFEWGQDEAQRARRHYINRRERLDNKARDETSRKARSALRSLTQHAKRDAITEAVRRARARRTRL